MSAPVEGHWIVDTVVIRNFLLVGRLDVLLALAGGAIYVPPVVLHPDDFRADRPPAPLIGPLSDLGKGFWYYRERSNSPHLGVEEHALTEARLVCFVSLPEFVQRGEILVTELEDGEIQWFAHLQDRGFLRSHGLKRIQAGEAACLAVALCRNWVLATDDDAALEALERLRPGHPNVRTRRLLEDAVRRGLLTCEQARRLHHHMVHDHGFWDNGTVSC